MKALAVLIALMASCSSGPQSQGNMQTPVEARKEPQMNIPKDTWEPIFFKAIDERARIANLKTLRSAALPDGDLEVRVWFGFGLTALEGLVLRRVAGQWFAIYLDGVVDKVNSNKSKRNLHAPKSGWDLCWQRLQDAGLLTLPDAAAIGCSGNATDGMSYVVEYNHAGIYRTYLYDNPNYAKCDEAKRMIRLVNLISEEFGVRQN
jgi:hypothetical protein